MSLCFDIYNLHNPSKPLSLSGAHLHVNSLESYEKLLLYFILDAVDPTNPLDEDSVEAGKTTYEIQFIVILQNFF